MGVFELPDCFIIHLKKTIAFVLPRPRYNSLIKLIKSCQYLGIICDIWIFEIYLGITCSLNGDYLWYWEIFNQQYLGLYVLFLVLTWYNHQCSNRQSRGQSHSGNEQFSPNWGWNKFCQKDKQLYGGSGCPISSAKRKNDFVQKSDNFLHKLQKSKKVTIWVRLTRSPPQKKENRFSQKDIKNINLSPPQPNSPIQ